MKLIKAVKPFFNNDSDFKIPPYEAWVATGGQHVSLRPYEKIYRSAAFHLNLPSIECLKSHKEARLRFVEGACLLFDAFPDYLHFEVIPMVWDCWPGYWKPMEQFLRRHSVQAAIFTSSQTADHFREVFPKMNILHLPEGIKSELYHTGKPLQERGIDYLEYGRCSNCIDSTKLDDSIKVLSSRTPNKALIGIEGLSESLADAKIVVALTRNDNQPEIAQGVDTLTQRYWECMLSGTIILGRAPQELIDIIGYDPVIKLKGDWSNPKKGIIVDNNEANRQILEILSHVEDYQKLVDKNRVVALEHADWSNRIRVMQEWLKSLGYIL